MKILVTLVIALLLFGCNEKQSDKIYVPTAQSVEIKSYKVGIHPYLNSKKMYEVYRPILDYLEDNLEGVHFILETSKAYSTYEEKLYKKEFAFSLPNPFQTINSLKYGYKVIAKMKPDSVFKGIFVVRNDTDIKTYKDVEGRVMSFPAPTALAATMMPLLFLHENSVDIDLIEKKFVGSQYSSILNVYSKDSVIGATWPPPWETWRAENPNKAKELRVIWETEPLVNNGFVIREDVDQKIGLKVAKLLVELDHTQSGKKLLEAAGFEGFEYANNQRYNIVKNFVEKYEQEIGVIQ